MRRYVRRMRTKAKDWDERRRSAVSGIHHLAVVAARRGRRPNRMNSPKSYDRRGRSDILIPEEGLMSAETNKEFVRNHFEEFVNRKNLDIADRNFAADFQEHGADSPPGRPVPPVRSSISPRRSASIPTLPSKSRTSSPRGTR